MNYVTQYYIANKYTILISWAVIASMAFDIPVMPFSQFVSIIPWAVCASYFISKFPPPNMSNLGIDELPPKSHYRPVVREPVKKIDYQNVSEREYAKSSN